MKTNVTLTIDYDEAEFVSSTQEEKQEKRVPYERPIPLANPVRGLTP